MVIQNDIISDRDPPRMTANCEGHCSRSRSNAAAREKKLSSRGNNRRLWSRIAAPPNFLRYLLVIDVRYEVPVLSLLLPLPSPPVWLDRATGHSSFA